MLNKKDFFKLAVKLAFPIMIQNLISTLVNTADTVMLGYVNQTAMSATSLANQFTFIFFCFLFGASTGTSVLCAQYFGKKDLKTIERIIGLATRLATIISIVFFSAAFFFPKMVMKIFTNSPETIEAGARYLKVVAFAYLPMGFSQVYLSAARSIGKVVMPSVTYIASLVTNIFFNAVFIFGFFGFPKLGITGVAIGTVISRCVESVICLFYSGLKCEVKFRLKYVFEKSGILLADFLKICLPSIANDVIWSLATTVFTAILGHIGDDMVAANAVAIMVVNVGAIACRGFANATTIVVSNALGENKIEETKVYARRMLLLTIAVSLLGGIIIIAIRPVMLVYYKDKLSPTALSYLSVLMFMTTWRLLGEGINTCLICGCFRGGGDTKFGMILDSIFMWAVAVPLMALAAYVFKLPALAVYFVMSLDEFYKMPVVFIHYKKMKWLNNITRNFD